MSGLLCWIDGLRITPHQFESHPALGQFGCLEFTAVTEGQDEIALSYWPSEEHIRTWKSHSEHVLAQQLGRERWYESYVVQVAEITREYRFLL
jgi:heme-degrading monooxygenase HmoA